MEKPDIIETTAGPLTIQPVEHASLVLAHGKAVLHVDPVGGASRYRGPPPPTAIAITHQHGDHFDTATLEELVGTRSLPMIVSEGVRAKLPVSLAAGAQVVRYGEQPRLGGIGVRVVRGPQHLSRSAAVPPQGSRQRLRLRLRRQDGLCRRRHRAHARNAGADRHRRRVPADEPALHDDRPSRRPRR